MQIIKELQRRNVFRVAIGYIVSSWLLLQVADLVLENIGAPDWVMQTFMLLLALGFPMVLFFSWVYEVTPEGIKRESEIEHAQSNAHATGRKLDRAIMLVLVVALAYLAYDRVGQSERGQEPIDSFVSEEQTSERSGPPMLAVLPFTTSSLGGDSEFFASGVHDDLLTQLAQLQSIRVISRTSVMEYRNTERNIREIGKALNADAILEGGVQSAGDQIRINMQLIDARTDEHLWAQTYDRELTTANIFELQTEIARSVTSAMQTTLTTQDVSLLTKMPTENLAAYRAYHRAMEIRDAVDNFETDAFRQALEEAVALDPTYTQAWAELAGIHSFANFSQKNPESLERAEYALEQIRLLAPQSADYLIAQAFYAYYVLRDYDRAYQLIKEAQVLRPGDARLFELKSWIQRRLGDVEGRIESIRQARKLDPRNPKWTREIVRDLMMTHHFDEAKAEINNSKLQDYSLSHLHGMLQLMDHRDFDHWTETMADIQREFGVIDDPHSLWESHIANRDYEAAEVLANGMLKQWIQGTSDTGLFPDKLRTQIITYWFLRSENRLAELLIEAQAYDEESTDINGAYLHPGGVLDAALVTAVDGDARETERLIRRWERMVTEDLAEKIHSRHRACRILGMAGSITTAIECIKKGLDEPSFVMPFMEPYLPYYDSMRDEPEFADFLVELGEAESGP